MSNSRRRFLKEIGATALLTSAGAWQALGNEEKAEERILLAEKKISANDKIRIGVIGLGIMGNGDLRTALKVDGVELAGVCDLYEGRLTRAKERYGNDLFTTRHHEELLDRKDIDAVIIATSDNWHSRITADALKKKKAVYCEKPMVHKISQGMGVVNAQKQTKGILQIGSQRVSSVSYAKAKELYKGGEIGQLNCIEATTDRQSAIGAWEYTMPNDISPSTVDWERYTAGGPKMAFDPKKFFWWRNYKDFGTGVAGDLFVHLASGIHFITDSVGPTKIFSTGQLNYWKDGRDVPDVMTAIMDYPATPEHPAFQVMLRVNFISGLGDKGTTTFIGSEGAIEMLGNGFNVTHHLMPKAPGIGGYDALDTYPQAMQDQLMKSYNEKYTKEDRIAPNKPPINYKTPDGYNEQFDHFVNFFESIRSNKPVVEDAVFGFRACAPCLACNDSYFQKKIIYWDPQNMKLKI
jgi:predicted dehydrogenase